MMSRATKLKKVMSTGEEELEELEEVQEKIDEATRRVREEEVEEATQTLREEEVVKTEEEKKDD